MQSSYHTDIRAAKQAALDMAKETQRKATVAGTFDPHNGYAAIPASIPVSKRYCFLLTVHPNGVIED